MNTSIALSIAGLLCTVSGMALAKLPTLKATPSATTHYQCDDGTRVQATYYSLSDKSLDFVKLKLKGTTHTLPLVVSASGNRYTDLHRMEWVTKGPSALLNTDVSDEKSAPMACAAVAQKK